MWKRRENRVVQKLYIVHQGRYKPPFYVVCGLAEEFDSGLRHFEKLLISKSFIFYLIIWHICHIICIKIVESSKRS